MSLTLPNKYQTRLLEMEREARNIYQGISGKFKKISLSIDPETDFAEAFSEDKEIFINPFFLINSEDFPHDLQFAEIDKNDLPSFQRLKTWIAQEFEFDEDNLSLSALASNFEYFQALWSSKFDLNRMRKFVLAHEVAHIFHRHCSSPFPTFATLGPCLISSVIALELFEIPTALAISLMLFCFVPKALKAFKRHIKKTEEKQADLTATRYTKDFEAAIHFMGCVAPRIVNQDPWHKKFLNILYEPEIIIPTHPSSQERINYLSQASREFLY